MARGHAEALAPMVEEAGRGLDGGFASLDRIAVTIGPGSFTGIRVGLALARAMGLALGVPVVGVPTLVAFAAPLLSEPRPGIIAAAIDARHGSVYFQLFESSGRPLGPAALRQRCGNACAASAPGPRCSRATRPTSSPPKRTARACPTTSRRRPTRPTSSRSPGSASRSTRSAIPARPLYVKPPDARPNPAEPIARTSPEAAMIFGFGGKIRLRP